MTELAEMRSVVRALPRSRSILLEAGTPLIKRYGIGVISEIRRLWKNAFVVADIKTMDVGALEADIAADGGADAATCIGLASGETINSFIAQAKKRGMKSVLDMMNVRDPVALLRGLNRLPDIVSFHRPIDVEFGGGKQDIAPIEAARREFGRRVMIAAAGGLEPRSAKAALKAGADIIIVGRYITGAGEPARKAEELLRLLSPRQPPRI